MTYQENYNEIKIKIYNQIIAGRLLESLNLVIATLKETMILGAMKAKKLVTEAILPLIGRTNLKCVWNFVLTQALVGHVSNKWNSSSIIFKLHTLHILSSILI